MIYDAMASCVSRATAAKRRPKSPPRSSPSGPSPPLGESNPCLCRRSLHDRPQLRLLRRVEGGGNHLSVQMPDPLSHAGESRQLGLSLGIAAAVVGCLHLASASALIHRESLDHQQFAHGDGLATFRAHVPRRHGSPGFTGGGVRTHFRCLSHGIILQQKS